MFDDINNFFYRNIVVRYKEYQNHREEIQSGNCNHTMAALELAEALYHFREQLDSQIRPSWKQVYNICPDYRLIANAANVFKHGQLDKPDHIGPPLISKNVQIVEMTVSTFFTDESGEYSNNEKAVYANCTDGIERNFDQALANVMNYWLQFMRDIGEKDFGIRAVPDEPGTRYVAREDASSRLDLNIVAGLSFSSTCKLLRYDTALGYAKPIDLTGCSLSGKIWKPAASFDLTVTSADGLTSTTVSYELTDEEAVEHNLIKEEVKRALIKDEVKMAAFMKKVFNAHRDEIVQMLKTATWVTKIDNTSDDKS